MKLHRVPSICALPLLGLSLLLDAGAAARIDAVFFAQTHVQKPDSPYFKLVGNRDALIKVHVIAPGGEDAPAVSARLALRGAGTNLVLRGPAVLPAAVPSEPGVALHRFDDSFTGTIPREWVQRGLQVTVKAGDAELAIPELKVGAPTVAKMTMFDIHFFTYENLDYTNGWERELEARWPVAKLEVQRVPRVVFPQLVIPPRPAAGLPAVRCGSPEEYLQKTGKPFDGEQMAASGWKSALQDAGAQRRLSVYYVNIGGKVYAGGQAGAFGGVGKLGRTGVLHHELGHALGRPHLMGEANYPYRDTMFGIVGKGPHVGPTWGFDPRLGLPGAPPGQPYFIPPVVQPGAGGGVPGEWKHDPMQGGMSDQEPGFQLRMFSDYCVRRMQEFLEGHVAVWDDARRAFVSWDDEAGNYGRVLGTDGFPAERDAQVISLLAGVSGGIRDCNIAYPPIGPYVSGLLPLFDPAVPGDRARAAQGFAPGDGCDVSLRVEQGGKVKTYMLPVGWQPGDNGIRVRALNLPARDGNVTRIELLLTPDAEKNGLPAEPEVLDVWKGSGG